MDELLTVALGLHRLVTRTQCGAISIPLVHHHGAESDARPGPLRTLRCTEDVGHSGLHRDCICCYNFQTFEDWQVVARDPRIYDVCTCGQMWRCPTVKAIQEAAVKLEAKVDG